MKTIIIAGRDFPKHDEIIITLAEVAQRFGTLSDSDFSSVVQEYNASEDEVMEQMSASHLPEFIRYATGWDVKQ